MNLTELISSEKYIDQDITVCGWVTTHRDQKTILFISLNDGSSVKCLQVVVDLNEDERSDKINKISRGASIKVKGKVIKSPAKGQLVEMNAKLEDINILGEVDVDSYPMSKSRHSLEYVRSIPHLKVRTNIGAMVARVRNTCSFATHKFFPVRGPC